MSLKTNALADASSLYSKQKSALSGVKSSAANMSGVASGLYSTGRGLLGQYSNYYSGLINSLPGQAEMPLADYVNAAANDVASNFDRSRGIQNRNMGRMGINPNSGRWQGLMANLSRNEAATRAGAMTQARITGQQENWNRSLGAAQVGTSLASMGIGAQQSAGSLYGSAGGLYGQAANQYGNAANEAGQYAGGTSIADQLAALLTPATTTGTKKASTKTTEEVTAPYYLAAGAGGAAGTDNGTNATSWLSSVPALQQGLLTNWGTHKKVNIWTPNVVDPMDAYRIPANAQQTGW